MIIRTTLLAAAASALPWFAPFAAAAGQVMSPAMAHTPEAGAALLAALTARRTVHGLDTDHGFAASRRHSGADGSQVSRFDHT